MISPVAPFGYFGWRRALASAVIAAVPNFAMFQLMLMLLPADPLRPYLALGVGIIAGMGVNYLASQYWFFRPVTGQGKVELS